MPNYRFSHCWHNRRDSYPNGKGFNANKVEPPVWRFVSRACYGPALRILVAWRRKRQAKATKCNPAKTAGNLS